ncbi:unnamed protein product [Sphacelaria rigidula]
MLMARGMRLPRLSTGRRWAIARVIIDLATTVASARRMPSMLFDRRNWLRRGDRDIFMLQMSKYSLHISWHLLSHWHHLMPHSTPCVNVLHAHLVLKVIHNKSARCTL